MLILRQSTSIDIRMGPFVDATDGVTPETGITLGAADQAEVLKANGAATVAMGGTFAAVTGGDGWYDYTCAAGDVDTVGEVAFVVQDASVCLPVFTRAYVVEEAVYDALFAASAVGPLEANDTGTGLTAIPWNAAWDAEVQSEANDALVALGLDHLVAVAVTGTDVVDNSIVADLVSSSATSDYDDYVNTTDSLQALRDRGDAAWTTGAGTGLTPLASGTAQGGTASTIQLASGETMADDEPIGNVIKITSGTGAGQARIISDYTGSTDTATVARNWTTTPDATSVYEMVEGQSYIELLQAAAITAAAIATDAIDADALATDAAEEIADTVWDEARSAHVTAGSFGEAFRGVIIGTAQGGTSTTIQLASGAITSDDQLNGATIRIVGGTGANQSGRIVDDSTASTDTCTISPVWDTTPDNTSVYEVLHTAPTSTGDPPTVDLSSGALTSINAEVDTALTDYDPPTKAELDVLGTAALATQASVNTVDSNVDAILVDTGTTIPGILGTPAGADLATDIAANQTDLNTIITQRAVPASNSAFTFNFLMVDDTNQNPATGLTVTGTRSIDGAAFASVGGTITEIASGMYEMAASSADMNGGVITFRFTAAAAEDALVTVITDTGV